MISWEDVTPRTDLHHCALCGQELYPEELRANAVELRPTVWNHLCGACERRWWISSAETVMSHFAERLRHRGHIVLLNIDGRQL